MTDNRYGMADKLKEKYFIRDDALRYSAASSSGARRRRGRNYTFARPADVKQKKSVAANVKRSEKILSAENGNAADGAVKVKNKLINPLFVGCLVVATIMLLSLVMCFAEVYQTANSVGKLERQLETLKAEEEELTVRLDAKKDLKEIENYATTKLGMVSEDSIQKRFVSLSEGEHIDIMESTETGETTGGVMLSSILSSIGRFFDRFK